MAAQGDRAAGRSSSRLGGRDRRRGDPAGLQHRRPAPADRSVPVSIAKGSIMADRLDITAGERLEVIQDTPDVLTVEAAYAPGGIRPPAHYHPRQDEHFEVLEGSLRVQVAGTERDLHAGDVLDIRRGRPH